jgi:hypothetical protein
MGRLKRRFLQLQSAWGRQRLNDEVLSNAGRPAGDRPPILGTFGGLASYEMNWKTVEPSLFRAVVAQSYLLILLCLAQKSCLTSSSFLEPKWSQVVKI